MDQLIPAIAAFLAGVGAWFAGRARTEAKQANKAVNNAAHGQPRIYDMIFDLHTASKELIAWKHSYDGGPLDNGAKVKEFVDRIDSELTEIRDDVKLIRTNCKQCQDE
jgi:hypothetical protein